MPRHRRNHHHREASSNDNLQETGPSGPRKRLKAFLAVGCTITLILFGIIIYLMRSINPEPLDIGGKENKTSEDEDLAQNQILKDLQRRWFGDSFIFKPPNRTRQDGFMNSKKNVVPPIWPPMMTNERNLHPQDRIIYERDVQYKPSTPSSTTTNDTASLMCKRSVNDGKKIESDLNSVILKIIDGSGKFNIEIKIVSNDALMYKNGTRQNATLSDKSKYSMMLKTKQNDQFKIIKRGEKIILTLKPNESLTVTTESENKKNMIQAMVDGFNNITKDNIKCNKSSAMPNYNGVLKPIVLFYNQTKLINNSNTKVEYKSKDDLLEKLNNVSDCSKTNLESHTTANNVHNITRQTENMTLENATSGLDKAITEINNSTISTKVFEHESSITAKVNLAIPLPNTKSIQSDTRNLIKIKELLQSQQQLKFKNMGR